MYYLLRAICTVKRIDNSSLRLRAFEDIADKSIIIRTAYRAFRMFSHTPMGALMLFLYGLKCYMSIEPPTRRQADLLCFASYPNEHAAVNHIKDNLSGIDVLDLRISRQNVFNPSNWVEAIHYILAALRLYRFARRCSRKFHFMPACRVFSTLAFYLRYKRVLFRARIKGILIANHYSPECVALAATAQMNSMKVIFTNHAHVPSKIPYLPSPNADLAILTSEAALHRYKEQSRSPFHHVLIGYEQQEKPLSWNFPLNGKLALGIFLTSLTNKGYVRELIDTMHDFFPSAHILLRPHPVELVNEDFSDFLHDCPFVELNRGAPLSDNINRCDLAVCGNSSVVIEILKGGCPVLYDPALDRLPNDYNGFLEGGLIPAVNTFDEHILDKMADFYKRADWVKIMQHYDASYRNDKDRLLGDAAREVTRVLTL